MTEDKIATVPKDAALEAPPDYFAQNDRRGFEDTRQTDVLIPRLAWGNSGDKKADKPRATLFRDFLAVIIPGREMIALSFKSSGIKAAKTLWGLATMRNKPVFAGRYLITTGVELKPKPHQIYKVENAGWVSKEDAILGEQMFEAVKTIDAGAIDRDKRDDVIDDSMAANPEGTTTEM